MFKTKQYIVLNILRVTQIEHIFFLMWVPLSIIVKVTACGAVIQYQVGEHSNKITQRLKG